MNEPVTDPVNQAVDKRSLKARLIVGAVLLAGLVFAWIMGSAVIPRWWGRRIGDLVDGRLFYGSFLGVVIGAVLTLVPLMVLLIGWHFRGGWKRGLGFVLLAGMLATPNLATLGIVVGDGSAAHAGERILDVDGPGFRGGTLVGVVLGALAAVGLWFLTWSRRRNKTKLKQLTAERAEES